jgi:hypothetical protein
MKNHCETCKYFVKDVSSETFEAYGECRRYPPVSGKYPLVHFFRDGCGEWYTNIKIGEPIDD